MELRNPCLEVEIDPVEADSQNKFLSKILLEPDVDAHKLAYADWLQEFAKRSPCPSCECNATVGCPAFLFSCQELGCDTCQCCQATNCFEGYITDGRWERAEFIRCTDYDRTLKLYNKFGINWFGPNIVNIIGQDMLMIENGFLTTLKCEVVTMSKYLKLVLEAQPVCRLVLTDAIPCRDSKTLYYYWLAEFAYGHNQKHQLPLGLFANLEYLTYTRETDAYVDLRQALVRYLAAQRSAANRKHAGLTKFKVLRP